MRDANAHHHTIYLIGLMILIGPPNTGTQSLTGGSNPMLAVAVLLEIKPSVPWSPFSLHRMSGVINCKLLLAVFGNGDRKIYKNRMVLTGKWQVLSIILNPIYPKIVKQIKLQAIKIHGGREPKEV